MQTKLGQVQGKVTFMVIKEASGETINTASDIFKLMKTESRIDRECCWVIHLNSRNKIIEKELVSMGTVNASLVAPREIYRKALIQGSAAIIVVHNHPSGNSEASMEDIKVSNNLKKAADILHVKLLDFMVIGNDEFTSFVDKGCGGFAK